MANAVVTLNLGPAVLKRIAQAAKDELPKQVWQRAMARSALICQRVGEYLAERFTESDVARSILGQGPWDLQAHLGLNEHMATELVGGMARIMKQSVRLEQHAGGVVLRVLGVPADWEEYNKAPYSVYESYSSRNGETEIPVVDWLLVDPNIDIGQAAYNIAFLGEPFDQSILKWSRSHRAIMMKRGALRHFDLPGGDSPYMLPAICHRRDGKNFIEYTIDQEGVAQRVIEIVLEIVGRN